jgi:anaerobic ribonucleoside-triphosphate reductase
MKKFIVLVLVLVFIPCLSVYGQLAVADAFVATIMEETKIDQGIAFGQMIKDNITQIANFTVLIEQTVQQVQFAMQNLASAKDIRSWDDFTDWYNRQLYLERNAIETIKGMSVNIGRKSYSLWDIEGMADGFNESYVNYWNNEFTEEQRKAMWLELGLTPSNYAFVQPFREKGREVTRQLFTALDIQNKKNMQSSQNNKDILDKHESDSQKPPDQQIGQKEVEQDLLKVSISIDEKLSDISTMQALDLQAKGIDRYLDQTPPNAPPLSEWPDDGFEKF